MEKAIRGAFEKGNPEDRIYREKVYRSAFAALERAIASNAISPEDAEKRRHRLTNTIREIETEFIPALPTESDLRAARSAAPSGNGGAPVVEPDRRGTASPSRAAGPNRRVEPGFASPASGASQAEHVNIPDEVVRHSHLGRRRLYATLFVIAIVIAAAGAGAWWAVQSGILMSAEERDTSVTNRPKDLGGESFEPEQNAEAPRLSGEADADRSWVTVFSPSDPTKVVAPGDAQAEVIEEGEESFLRIRSGAAGDAISFDVGKGVLEQIAGGPAVFDIIARSEDGKSVDISVSCNLAELGDCGRTRYSVGYEKGDYLLKIELPDQEPGSAGTIAITPDVSGEQRALDVFEIRVARGE